MSHVPAIVPKREFPWWPLSGSMPQRMREAVRRCLGARRDLSALAAAYLKVLSGTFGRLVLQTAYFLVLVGTLSLEDMGTFAAIMATGMMIGCFSSLGYASVAYRAAAGRQRLLGTYTAFFYAMSALTLPLALLCALPFYALIFAGTISLPAFLGIIVADTTCFRVIDGLHAVSNGLGRFAQGATILILFAGIRAVAALCLHLSGSHALGTWAWIYFGANVAALALMLLAFRPRVRLRWHAGLFVGRFKEAILFAFVGFTSDVQREIDKLVLITMADERAAGLYAIASRVIELATVPIKTFYILYSRRLIAVRSHDRIVARNLRVEFAVGAASFAVYAAFLVASAWFPTILGTNIAAARPLYTAMLFVPVFKNMMDLHAELYFAYRRMGSRALMLLGLIVLKVGALAALVRIDPDPLFWGAGLNAVLGGLYAVSALTVYTVISQPAHRAGALAASA